MGAYCEKVFANNILSENHKLISLGFKGQSFICLWRCMHTLSPVRVDNGCADTVVTV